MMVKRRDRVRAFELIGLFGLRPAARIIEYFDGRCVPTMAEFHRGLRQTAVVRDWLAGARQDELSLRHGFSLSTVKRILNRHRREAFRRSKRYGASRP